MDIDALIEKYENELKAYKSGEMMSMSEAIHGEMWCGRILIDLRQLRDSSNG